MSDTDSSFHGLVHAAADALKSRRDEVNRLNVFPVPDGDTGTNMSLTMDAVLAELDRLPGDSGLSAICHAITHGSLMGARGNSGVILSQMLRGLCEVLGPATTVDAALVRDALERSVTVSFQAVRKPVEGTMLTVLRDAAAAAGPAVQAGQELPAVLQTCIDAAYESVRRTPDLLPVLKEAGVVDAGGYGLAILMEGLSSVLIGTGIRSFDVSVVPSKDTVALGVDPANDWDDDEYLYCTEFLLFGDGIDKDSVEEFVAQQGGSELVVGGDGAYKVHVHTDDPGAVLAYVTALGEVAEVHVNNMRRQTAERADGLRAERATATKPLGFVAVAAGEGLAQILTSLGVDRVVCGGQTMNPSTAELLEAIESVPANEVIVLPNNRNIILAAQQTVGIAGKPVGVVPTTSVPQSFAAMLAIDPSAGLEANVVAMSQAFAAVRTGEITTAIKDSKGKVGAIRAGQVIGIADHEIEAVGTSIPQVAVALLDVIAQDGEMLTVLKGADLSAEALAELVDALAAAHPELEIETHDGGQPLYPVIMAVE
ncbi:MAG: DAK2 domain-containing protein [Coriobacteriia bacterium]|nr:DAK2 domain-containing protein [Coriobacteriia bacterium]